MTIESRAEKGACVFDQKNPGWFEEIDTSTLDVGDVTDNTCPLAQLYGTYQEGRRKLFGHLRGIHVHRAAAAHGFFAEVALSAPLPRAPNRALDVEYQALTKAWKAAITRRRSLVDPEGMAA